ncbi:MotA/TolQ/ExbB proton channel family protein [Trichlorobacter lovleyi]|uniref:MotA/TolQ/ExbB proton channel family protein n=1 Tax=Trichlorobacter lovleyi TaxID=313985 RepID=UPI0022401E71|nr:MotA/TolQ/ExbB proton channel family protein [Trichlorobacter lovleyi]
MKIILLWVCFGLCIIGGMVLQGISVGVLLQPAAMVIILLPVLVYLLYSYGSGLPSFTARLLKQELLDTDQAVLDTVISLGFVFGTISMVAGMVMTMANLSDSSKLGAGIAMSFISAIYGATPAVLLLPLRSNATPAGNNAAKAGGYMAVTAFMLAANVMTVLYALGR